MTTSGVVKRLSRLVRIIVERRIRNQSEFRLFAKRNPTTLNRLFGYAPTGDMPGIHELITIDFHPAGLVMFNYSKLAHNELHLYPGGWTDVIRQCRGIVFDRQGNLVGLPFTKFFNHGETQGGTAPPRGRFVATAKYDGHLGIIFPYKRKIILTTRGDFFSPSSAIGITMLEDYIRKFSWTVGILRSTTLLVEIIHPDTRVFLNYPDRKFVLIGAYRTDTYQEYSDQELKELGGKLGLELPERWEGSIEELVAHVNDWSQTGKEGYVARYPHGREKFKFVSYLRLMGEARFKYNPFLYSMNRAINDDLPQKMRILSEETGGFVARTVSDMWKIAGQAAGARERWRQLYELAPPQFRTSAFQAKCRKFIKTRT